MALDPERASLVTQAYRYKIRKDDDTLALYPNSKSIELETSLDRLGGEALAQEIWDECSGSTRTFTLTFDGALALGDFVNGPPRYVLLFDRHPAADPAKVYTVVATKVRRMANLTVVTVRG